jgi:hypothetical protein
MFRNIATPRFQVTIVAAVLLACVASCGRDSSKKEASALVRVVTDLRMADNERKRSPLEQLRAMTCHDPEVCKVRDACVQAFDHHVRGVELGARLRQHLDRDAGTPEERAALLLEMNLEVEDGQKAMPFCEQGVADLRRKHKL